MSAEIRIVSLMRLRLGLRNSIFCVSTYPETTAISDSSFGLYLLPSTIMTWYPCPVFTSTHFGSPTVLTSSAYAAFSNSATSAPLVFHPRLPPCRALSSLNSRATSSNLAPSRSLVRASSFLECFSQRMCRLLMAVAGLSFEEAEEESSLMGLSFLEGLDFLPAIVLSVLGRGILLSGEFLGGVRVVLRFWGSG